MQQGTFKSYWGAICIPVLDKGDGTISNVTHDWAAAMAGLGGGLAVTTLRQHIRNYRVDIAKNRLAQMALNNNVQWMLFVDDDVLPPQNALLKMTKLWRSDPKYKMISGIYWSKSDPPVPLIFNGDRYPGELAGSVWDWTTSDLIQADAGGAGLLFVDADIFRKTEPPWFSCEYYFDDPRGKLDADRWIVSDQLSLEVMKGDEADEKVIKELKEKLIEIKEGIDKCEAGPVPPEYLMDQNRDAGTTEDLFFFKKIREELGIRPWFDCSIQAGHQDKASGKVFSITQTMPQSKSRYEGKMKAGEKVVIDIGAGESVYHIPDGPPITIDIDPRVNPDIIADARELPLPDNFADITHASHILEHFSFKETITVLKEWARVTKVGGQIILVVPNLKWASKVILKGGIDEKYSRRALFMFHSAGAPKGDLRDAHEDYHKAGFTPQSMEGVLGRVPGLADIKVLTSDGSYENYREAELMHNEDDLGYNIIAFATKVEHKGPMSLKLPINEQRAAFQVPTDQLQNIVEGKRAMVHGPKKPTTKKKKVGRPKKKASRKKKS